MKSLNLLRLLKYKVKTQGTVADRSKGIQSVRAEVINRSIGVYVGVGLSLISAVEERGIQPSTLYVPQENMI